MALKKRNTNEIRCRGISPILEEQLNNIAGNLGITLTQFLKPKLREIADSYPDKMKSPPPDY